MVGTALKNLTKALYRLLWHESASSQPCTSFTKALHRFTWVERNVCHSPVQALSKSYVDLHGLKWLLQPCTRPHQSLTSISILRKTSPQPCTSLTKSVHPLPYGLRRGLPQLCKKLTKSLHRFTWVKINGSHSPAQILPTPHNEFHGFKEIWLSQPLHIPCQSLAFDFLLVRNNGCHNPAEALTKLYIVFYLSKKMVATAVHICLTKALHRFLFVEEIVATALHKFYQSLTSISMGQKSWLPQPCIGLPKLYNNLQGSKEMVARALHMPYESFTSSYME